MMKRVILAISCAAAFLIGYGTATAAWPGVSDRDEYHGYFYDVHDGYGDSVISTGIPDYVDSADEFIAFIKDQLNNGTAQNKTGAAFIIQTMLGSPWSRSKPPTSAQIIDWESRVQAAEDRGYVTWSGNFTHSGNSYWQGGKTGANPDDDAFYYESGTRTSVIFRNSEGNAAYVLKRDCANPLTYGYMPGLDVSWNTWGWTTVQSTAAPGESVTYSHNINDFSYTAVPSTTYYTIDGASSTATGMTSKTGTTSIDPYQTFQVSESFTIPSNAAAGTKYCRHIVWNPSDAWGAGERASDEACVTVVIPAKLKAAMSVSPTSMAASDTATFTPSISATTNASPITVNCSIKRTLYATDGATTDLGSQDCVTTAGSSDIVIGAGASVILKTNTYLAPDDIAIGSKVCDVITITNPTASGYYDSASDQTASACVTIAKSPYVHFIGDVWAGGGFAAITPACDNSASITTVTRSHALSSDGTTPGSGTSFAAFALGKITNFGSGSASLTTSTGIGDGLTFSNLYTNKLGYYGASQHCITDYTDTYESSTAASSGNTDIAVGSSGSWRVDGDVTLHGTIGAGIQKVYYVNGNVTVSGNVTYPATFNAAGNIPSLVIIATGNIYVNADVEQMDGIFITQGTFYTCYPKTEPATINTCNKQLTVNGSVIANAVDLFRTAGAEGTTADSQKEAAEIFNLSPEVYIDNALNQSSSTVITTSEVRELPPRF